MSDVVSFNVRRMVTRFRAVGIAAGAITAVVTAWAAIGAPVWASRAYVAAEIGPVRIETLEARAEVANLHLFLIDWTAQGATLDPPSRAWLATERLKVLDSKAAIADRLKAARAAK